MGDFSKVDRPPSISNTPGGVWKIEKKRKARDGKNKRQKYTTGNEQKNREEDDSVLVDIDFNRDNDKECEDQMNYGLSKKKSLCTKIDLKI